MQTAFSLMLSRKFWVGEKWVQCVQVLTGFMQCWVLREPDPPNTTATRWLCWEVLTVRHASETTEQQAGNFLTQSLVAHVACPTDVGLLSARGDSQQEGTAPAPTCCPATHSWSSAELRGFSCVCGPGIQKVHFSVNDIKPQVNVWKPGNGFLLKQPNVFLSPLRLRISLLLSEKWSHSIWRLAPSDTAHLAFRLSGGLQWNHTWHSQSSWEKAGVLRVFSLSVKITEARTNPPFFHY